MTIEDLKNKGLIILECISGSRAYGLNTPESDTDIKGVFILPKSEFYGLNYISQVSNKTNDIVFYELGRFMELISVNNPNILELLNTPKSAIIYKHTILDIVDPKMVLSKLCQYSFGKFATSQIKKAKGLNKKIVNPISKERKSVLDFCFINYKDGSITIKEYLKAKGWKQQHCGLSKIPNMKGIYGIYYKEDSSFKGLIQNETSNTISLSAIPKGIKQIGLLYFNNDGYSTYCKNYKEYWNWVEERNESRYQNTTSHGKNYDSKNMMHTFRLLEMAIEIANDKEINVMRNDREFLLKIKSGVFDYDYLLEISKKKQLELEKAYLKTDLPNSPNIELIKKLSFEIRDRLYTLKQNTGSFHF